MSRIFWLASYPKSGNTWMRIFLENYRHGKKRPIGINELSTPLAAFRSIFDDITGLESSLLTQEESMRLRPFLYERMAGEIEENRYLKIHDACIEAFPGMPITSIKGTAGAIYIIRNPLDVAISWAAFNKVSIDNAINDMGNKNFALCGKLVRAENQLFQPLLTWSGHVESWVDNPWFPVEVIRYEDMQSVSAATFCRAVKFLNLSVDKERLRESIDSSDFHELKKQEQQAPFRESSPFAEAFFRQGKVGGWKNILTAEQVARIVEDHEPVMERFGYLEHALAWLSIAGTVRRKGAL